jgi:hypothetical protein
MGTGASRWPAIRRRVVKGSVALPVSDVRSGERSLGAFPGLKQET